MSSDQGAKKGGKGRGKGRRKGRGRGRGDSHESETVPGGLQQQQREEASQGATALPDVQPSSPAPQPSEEAERGTQFEDSETISPQKQGKKKRQRKRSGKAEMSSPTATDIPYDETRTEIAAQQPLKTQPPLQQSSKTQPPPQQPPKTQQPPQQPPKTQQPPQQPPKSQQPPQQPPKSQPPPQQPPQSQPPPQQPPKSQPPPQQPPKSQPPPQQPPKSQPPPQQPPKSQPPPQQPPKSQQPSQPQPPPAPSGPTSWTGKGDPKPPNRPDKGGRAGRPIALRVNFFPVKLPLEDIHHYDTEIKAKGEKRGEGYTKREAPKIIQAMVDMYDKENPKGPKLVYDRNGKNVYCRKPIPGIGKDKREYIVLFTTDNGREKEYTVQIQWTSQVSLHYLNEALEGRHTEIPRDTLQAVEVVINHLPCMMSIPVGQSFFSYPDGHEKDIGSGLQVWDGTFVSIRPTQWKMMLNVDSCSKAFYKAQSLLDFICEFFRFNHVPQRLDEYQRKDLRKEIKGLSVETRHLGYARKYRVSGLSQKSARDETFDNQGTQTSVANYFQRERGIQLQYPGLPCLKVGTKGTCMPIELCSIVQGQRKQGRLSAMQTQQMIRHTALPAPDRQQEIQRKIAKANYDNDPFCRDFGVKISKDMMQVPGRVLDPPLMNFGPEHKPMKEKPRDGVWDMQAKPMFKPMQLKEWALVSFENPRFLNERGIEFFISKLVAMGQEKGFQINQSPCFNTIQKGHQGIGRLFGKLHKDYPNLQLIVAMFPEKGNTDFYYEEVKYYGDVEYGIVSQCVKTRKTDPKTMANICLKINSKLGGTTFILDRGLRSPILQRPVIVFGADVTHPSAQDKTSPSIAAVVASMDSHPSLYSAEVRVQEHRVEMITDLRGAVNVLMKRFRNKTGVKPERIIFYRDGVSEGQFREVLIHELSSIQQACRDLNPKYQPLITFIVVQKRHHARFFAENPRDQKGKSRNIPAGTVVDQQVCHPFEFDWYLCSHAGIQGTSKPAHYHVLYDDSNFKSDDLQILTNQLCHTYVRCARAVSIPAPAYYAHHVAFRARYHLKEADRRKGDGSESSGSEGMNLSNDEMVQAVTINQRMNETMYFA